MKSQHEISQLFPRSVKGKKTKVDNARPQEFVSNHYEIELKDSKMKIFQYVIEIEPELPKDSSEVRFRLLQSVMGDLKRQFGYVSAKGEMMWGTTDVKVAKTINGKVNDQSFQLLIKPIKELTLSDYVKQSPDGSLNVLAQFLNINVKNQLKNMKMVELTMGKFYRSDHINDNQVKESGFSIWRGYKITVVPINFRLYLQVDVCSKVLRLESFLETLLHFKKQGENDKEINQRFIGSTIVMKYGNNKTYRIQEIDFKMNPQNTFNYKDGQISYIQYYKKNYGLNIKDAKQPLVKVLYEVNKQHKNALECQEIRKYNYLIPELVALTGLTDQQRKDFKIMKSLDQYTKLTAQDRMEQTDRMVKEIKAKDQIVFNIDKRAQVFNGFQLNEPKILLGKNKRLDLYKGSLNLKERVKDPAVINEAVFMYSISRDAKRDQDEADYAVDMLIKAGKTFGIEMKDPHFYEVKGNKSSDWKNIIKQHFQKKGKPDIIIFFVTKNEERLYSDIKKEMINEFNVPTQFVRRRTLSQEQKGVMSCASKIILQINAKLGHALWEVAKNHPFWQRKRIAIAAIACSKGKNGSTLSIVGTTNDELTEIYCDCKFYKSKKDLSSKQFESIFLTWIQKYFKKNNSKLPDILLVYREGLNDMQAKYEIESEVEGLREAIRLIPIKAKIANYQPTFQYILTSKKINTRMYLEEEKGKTINYYNPLSGSVVFEDLSCENYQEFYLASVNVNQGTCTPVKFKIACQNGEIPRDALAELTFEQCFNYPNWAGAVRVPGVLQCANKLSKFFSENVNDDLKVKKESEQMKSQYFFL